MENYVILCLIAGVAISTTTALLGNLMVWKGVSYLGDAIGHSSLLGIAVGVLTNNVSYYWIFLVCLLFAVLLVVMRYLYSFHLESIIVFNVQLFLSLGLVIIGWFYISDGTSGISYLFGDLFLLTPSSVVWLWILTIALIIYISLFWRNIILIAINNELAYSEGVKVVLNELIFMLFLSASIAFLVRFLGVFLVSSLLIIPALLANYITNSIRSSFIVSGVVCYCAICAGLVISFLVDIPVTPLITLVMGLIFLVVIVVRLICRKVFK